MSTLTAPGNPGESNSGAGGRKRAIASVAGGAALAAVVLGAAACAAPPAGDSRPVSLNGGSAAAPPSVLVPGTPAAVTSVPGAPKARAMTPAKPSQPGAESHLASGAAKSPGSSAPAVAASSAAGPAPSAGSSSTGSHTTGSAPPAAPSSAAPTRSAPSQSASAGSGGALSVSRGCAAQITVLEDQEMPPCSFTKSGGNPDYLYSVNLYVNGNLSLVAGSAPDGLTFTDTNNDTVFTIAGKPSTPGTYNLTVEFYAGTDTASASVTLVVSQDPNLQRLP